MSDAYCLKFRAINKYLIESMVNPSIYFANPDQLNDPFDCRMDVNKIIYSAVLGEKDQRQKDFLLSFLENKSFGENWKSQFENIGVFSVSMCSELTKKQPLMWSHYADEHRGLCVTYSFSGDCFTNAELLAKGMVKYCAAPDISGVFSSNFDPVKITQALLYIFLFNKSSEWGYESEFRLLKYSSGTFPINPSSIHEICFGLRTPKSDIDFIKKIASDYCGCTSFYQMQHDDSAMGFKAVKL
ncbi:hypothetical protein [Methylomonas albis]|uniref:DUF2971 domain-containing protein n=1 Tax=Methylomonas albis TaxID=1854563 RepID=A0ABR9D8I9_9GAMM|nr:DUF2971 domain-containing protein [Methylomonas albis]MBD9358237.1 DUF2971 domain-containing protein [Methylomonas albis]CAD6881617.1 hypothetical protein [Methylomonas albis]